MFVRAALGDCVSKGVAILALVPRLAHLQARGAMAPRPLRTWVTSLRRVHDGKQYCLPHQGRVLSCRSRRILLHPSAARAVGRSPALRQRRERGRRWLGDGRALAAPRVGASPPKARSALLLAPPLAACGRGRGRWVRRGQAAALLLLLVAPWCRRGLVVERRGAVARGVIGVSSANVA